MTAREPVPRQAADLACIERAGDDARAVILLHGIGGRATIFAPLLAHWPAGRRLIAVDLPGYGSSAPLAQDCPVAADYAARLDDFRAAIGLAAFDLVGHSLGCLVAAAYAARYGERVRQLVLMAPARGYRVPPGGALPESIAKRIADLETLGPEGFAAGRAANLVADAGGAPDVLAQVEAAMAAVDPRGYTQAARMLASGDLIADLSRVRAPLLILVGAADAVTPPEGARRLAAALVERIGGSPRLEIIPAAGHAVSLEQPARVAAVLATFLEAP